MGGGYKAIGRLFVCGVVPLGARLYRGSRVVPLGARLYRGSPRQCEKNFNPYEFYIINV